MKIHLSIWKGPDKPLEYKRIDANEVIIKDGVSIKTDDGVLDTFVVVVSEGLYHPVFDIWVN